MLTADSYRWIIFQALESQLLSLAEEETRLGLDQESFWCFQISIKFQAWNFSNQILSLQVGLNFFLFTSRLAGMLINIAMPEVTIAISGSRDGQNGRSPAQQEQC